MGVAEGLSLVAILLAAYIKGAIGFGFPTISTPVLALFMDLRTAIVLLIVPNIVMDGIQAARRPGLLATLRRHALLYGSGIVGTVVGTRALLWVSSARALLILGIIVLAYVAVNASRISVRIPPGLERYLSPPVGFLAGVIGGITNVPGTPLVLYFYALGMDKTEFVRSIAFTFVIYKLAQLASVTYFGLLTWRILGLSILATALGLGAFGLGLKTQDRVNQLTFNRMVLGFLAILGVGLIVRAAG